MTEADNLSDYSEKLSKYLKNECVGITIEFEHYFLPQKLEAEMEQEAIFKDTSQSSKREKIKSLLADLDIPIEECESSAIPCNPVINVRFRFGFRTHCQVIHF